MIWLSRADQLALVAEASLAPSVHNIQPARWRFGQGEVVLLRARDRTLPVADPSGHDVMASLGAAFEGMAIALTRKGLQLHEPRAVPTREAAQANEVVATASIADVEHVAVDALAGAVVARRAYRGKFDQPNTSDHVALAVIARDDARMIDRTALPRVATRHDDATWRFESRDDYHRELWHWLRLTRRHPRYARDGLTGECLALTTPEAWAAQWLLTPKRFRLLGRLGMAKPLVSEGGAVRSAAAAIVFCPLVSMSAFDVGRRFYRLWLEITAAGFAAVPMSATADDDATRVALAEELSLPTDRRIANVLRVGRVAATRVAKSPRLPPDELLV